MRFIDYITMGFKNIWRRKSRSFLTIFAVVIGAISIIIMLSLVLGAKQVATRQLESIDGLTLISVSANPEITQSGNLLNTDSNGDEFGNKLNDSTVSILKQIPNVVDASPVVGIWIKSAKLEDKKYRANIMAYPPETKVLNIPVSVGRGLNAEDMDKIVIGTELLRSFGYAKNPSDIIGKRIILYTNEYVDWGEQPPKPPENADDEYWNKIQQQSHEITAEIVGVITNGPDESQNYITLNWGKKLMTGLNWRWDDGQRKEYEKKRMEIQQQLKSEMNELQKTNGNENIKLNWDELVNNKLEALGYNNAYFQNNSNFLALEKQDNLQRNGYGSILLRVDNTANIESVEKNIKNLGFGTATAKQMLDEIEKIFGLIGMIIGAIGGIVLFVAALGIINNMIMSTYERTREIGVLRACGATRGTIRNMFIFEAGMLGFLGGVIGLVLSFGLAKILNIIGNQIALSQSVAINNIISFPLWLIIGVISLTTIIGILAGLLPAIRASHLNPVDALKYE